MYLTFKNISESHKMIISVERQNLDINPGESVQVYCGSENPQFIAQSAFFDELSDAVKEMEDEMNSYSLKDKILARFAKKVAQKLPEIALNMSVKYELSSNGSQDTTVTLSDCIYPLCDGSIADFFDLTPVMYIFGRAETENGNIRVLDVSANNRKKYLRMMRNLILFSNGGLFFIDLFFAVPEYLITKFLSTHFFTKRLFTGLYNKSPIERERVFAEKEERYEKEDKNGCLPSILKGLILFVIIAAICFWAATSDPDVVISEDFQSVVCFDETFVKINGGLPENAEDVFLEDYTAYYPLADGEYDMDNYYCYIFETPDGTRYMWLKDGCSKEENEGKDYDDYENPLVYKSVGEGSE